VTEEVEAREAAGLPTDNEKRYPDPYGLYRRWFNASEDIQDEANGDTLSSAELGELWKRWFEATAGLQSRALEAENSFLGSLAPLWSEMAEDVSAEMLSEETLPEDPLKFFLRWYNDTNERWSQAADELLRRDEVLESTGHFFETYARSHRELRRISEEGLKHLQIPTRSDVARVARLVVVVENKVDRVEEALEEFIYGDSEPATAGAVGSLEERMDRLEGKMDRILAGLEKLGAGSDLDPEETPREPTPKKGRRAAREPDARRKEASGIKAGSLGYS
jgi:polyhydroxyalkanoic acid synthase PhaR subunit